MRPYAIALAGVGLAIFVALFRARRSIQVDDLDAVEQRVIAAGLAPFSHGDYEPGRRFYFFDPDGIEYEVVSYAEPRPR